MFQEGCLGLIKAADTFNPDFGVKFSTYAYKCIKTSIHNVVRKRTLLTYQTERVIHKISPDFSDKIIKTISHKQFLSDAIQIITPRQKEIAVKLAVAGGYRTLARLTSDYGASENIRQHMAKARRKIESWCKRKAIDINDILAA